MKRLILALTLTLIATSALALEPKCYNPPPVKYILVNEVYGQSMMIAPLSKDECNSLRDGIIANMETKPKLVPPAPSQVERQIYCLPLGDVGE